MSRKCVLSVIRSGLPVALSLFACVAVQAATVPYGDFLGSHVDFLSVQESSTDALPLFGAPVAQGNNLVFTPLNFEAKAENSAVDGTDSQLNFTLMPHPGYLITAISISEFGDYTLSGDDVFVGVGATAYATVGAIMVSNSDTFHDDTEVDLATPWGLGFTVDVPDTEGKVEFVMDNSLAAIAGSLDLATIRKKGATISVHTVAVPEPATALLGLSGIGLGLIFRPRSRRNKTTS